MKIHVLERYWNRRTDIYHHVTILFREYINPGQKNCWMFKCAFISCFLKMRLQVDGADSNLMILWSMHGNTRDLNTGTTICIVQRKEINNVFRRSDRFRTLIFIDGQVEKWRYAWECSGPPMVIGGISQILRTGMNSNYLKVLNAVENFDKVAITNTGESAEIEAESNSLSAKTREN